MSSKSLNKSSKQSKPIPIDVAEQRDFAAWHDSRFSGRPQRELAAEHGVKLTTFRTRVHRHQERLREDDKYLEAVDRLLADEPVSLVAKAVGINGKAAGALKRMVDEYDLHTADA